MSVPRLSPDRRLAAALLAPTLLLACAEAPATPDALEAAAYGRELAADPGLSSSSFNVVACADCHALSLPDERILPGHPLPGAAARPSFWGGSLLDLKSAVDACLVFHMKGDALDPDDDRARALYEFLVSIADEGPTEALPLTVVKQTLTAPERGDPARGAEIHRLACERCHGAAGSGDDRLFESAPGLPDAAAAEALAAFPDYEPAAVFAEKVRHGQFFGVGGTMPLFSLEALSDEDLGALLAFYGL